jgi:hypothetical protein
MYSEYIIKLFYGVSSIFRTRVVSTHVEALTILDQPSHVVVGSHFARKHVIAGSIFVPHQ